MKPVKCLALVAIILAVVALAINCVQQGTVTPVATPTPTLTPSPSPEPLPAGNFSVDEQIRIYGIADPNTNPYVHDSVAKTAWRTQHEKGGNYTVNTDYRMDRVVYMRFREIAPGVDRTRVLPAAIIVPGNPETAGVNVVAFVNTSGSRVEYIGFIPREGTPVDNATFTPTTYGLEERDPVRGLHQYNNVTIVDTGFFPGMTLTQDQIDEANALAMTNATVRGYIGSHDAVMLNISVIGYETGHPYRYVLAYPMVTLDVVEGITHYDTIFVLADLKNDRVAGIEHGDAYLW